MVPFRRRLVGEGLVHGVPRPGGEVVSERQDGYHMPFVQEDGGEYAVAKKATQAGGTHSLVLDGIPISRGNGPKTSNGTGDEGFLGRGAIYGQ